MVNVIEEFLEFILDGVLVIEVWGYWCVGNGSFIWEVDFFYVKIRILYDRWNEVM